MFRNLMASAPRRGWLSPGAWLVSTALQGAVVVLLVTLATEERAPGGDLDHVSYVDLGRPVPQEVQPPPPPPAPERQPAVSDPDPAAPPRGFQTLATPEILAGIPEPGRVAIRAEDFSGMGIAGGIGGGRPLTVADTARPAPVVAEPVSVAVVDERPRVLNLDQLKQRMRELYPQQYRMMEIEGEVLVQLVVDVEGRVETEGVQILQTSHAAFAEPTLALVQLLQWEPARRNGKPVRVWVRLPVSWSTS